MKTMRMKTVLMKTVLMKTVLMKYGAQSFRRIIPGARSKRLARISAD